MRSLDFDVVFRVFKASLLGLVAWIGVLIALTTLKYFPPTFEDGFLIGREPYFYSWYAVAFYTHVVSASLGLFIGLIQSIDRIRQKSTRLHRIAGKAYVGLALIFIAPSGFAMAFKANGSFAILSFAILALSMAATTWMGWQHIRLGNVSQHRVWMTRSFLLMCSAATLRFLAAIASSFSIAISYDAMAWLSWVPQLAIFEIARVWSACRRKL